MICKPVTAMRDLEQALFTTIEKIPGTNFCKVTGAQMCEFLRSYSPMYRNRAYHNVYHILDGLSTFAAYGPEDPVRDFAWIWHDVIWGDEDASARVAVLFADLLGVSFLRTEIIMDLILQTAHTYPPYDPKCAALFLDVDLSILGSKHKRFQEYREQIKQEYLTIYTEEQFAEGTKIWAKQMIGKRQIFHSKELRHLEEKARKNLSTLLE